METSTKNILIIVGAIVAIIAIPIVACLLCGFISNVSADQSVAQVVVTTTKTSKLPEEECGCKIMIYEGQRKNNKCEWNLVHTSYDCGMIERPIEIK